MKQASGTYDLASIKYFSPDGIVLTFDCPTCGEKIEIDAGDDFIEYPEPEMVRESIECDCGREIKLQLKIKMTVTVEYDVI